MDFFNHFENIIKNIIRKIINNSISIDLSLVKIDVPKDTKFGDISTNVAMIFSKKLNKIPIDLAAMISDKILEIEGKNIEKLDIIKPGFINITFKKEFWHNLLNNILKENREFGRSNIGNNEKVNIEFVSTNPTGPLHIGHGRGAVLGDILANLYSYMGYNVTREYYINDAGNQIYNLGKSIYYRYCELLGKDIERSEVSYPGEYIIDISKEIINKDGDIWLKKDIEKAIKVFSDIGIQNNMLLIKEDLKSLGINHDVFTSEREIATDVLYNKLQKYLEEKGVVYLGKLPSPKGSTIPKEQNDIEQKLFRTTQYGDDIDRALEKKDGTRTYFAGDILYHYDKIQRGFYKMIDFLGVDHKGYKKRLVAAVSAISDGKAKLSIVFNELVNLLKDGQPVKMSKRAGNFVTLKEVLTEINKDVFRFMMISRSNDTTLEFDLKDIASKSDKNPVFYVQYAYARICSVLSKAQEQFQELNNQENMLAILYASDKKLLQSEAEISIIKTLFLYPRFLKLAIDNNNVHLLYIFLLNIAKRVHYLWNVGKEDLNLRFIITSNKNLTFARVSLLLATKDVILSLFKIIGISDPEKM